MRVVLLGGLSAVLAALVVAGGFIIQRPRGQAAAPVVGEAEEPPAPPPVRRPRSLRALPSIPARPCVAPVGHACWRGQVVVSAEVRAAWERAREAQGPRDDADDAEVDHRHPHFACALGVHGGREDDLLRARARQFHVVATPVDDDPARTDLTSEEAELVEVDAGPDGTFELLLGPGRYDVEATSGDGILIGGVDGLVARAGAAEDGPTIVVGLTVALAGQVIDADGVAVGCEIELRRRAHSQVLDLAYSAGPFAFRGLRTGTYQLTVRTDDGSETIVQVASPAKDVRLTLRPPAVALVVVARREDGHCPRGKLSFTGANGGEGKVSFHDCQAILPAVAPQRDYRLHGTLEGRPYDQVATFASSSSGFVCLDPWCGAVEAHLLVRVVDAAGDDVDAQVSACVGERCEVVALGPRTIEFRQTAGAEVVVRGTGEGALGTATATLWTRPGLNHVVLRLPGTIAPVATDEFQGGPHVIPGPTVTLH